ncbi:MAG: hypothetical protein GY828_07395, partial [Candidatus Gracilibacteria bacterium]|nr:hypothetical protein [Candidatus Gracilibacteria bacterium]
MNSITSISPTLKKSQTLTRDDLVLSDGVPKAIKLIVNNILKTPEKIHVPYEEIEKIPQTFLFITEEFITQILNQKTDIWSNNWNGLEGISIKQKDAIAQLFTREESIKRIEKYLHVTLTSLYSDDFQNFIDQKHFIINKVDLLLKMFSQLINGDDKIETLYSQLKMINTTQGPLYVSQKNIKVDQGNS